MPLDELLCGKSTRGPWWAGDRGIYSGSRGIHGGPWPRYGHLSVRLEAIALGDGMVRLPWLPLSPEVLEEGGWKVFCIVVMATHAAEPEPAQGQAHQAENHDGDDLDGCGQ